MASIRANKKNGKIVSYKFTAYVGQSESGEYLRKYTTWKIPEGVSPSKAKRMAEREAEKWEKELKESPSPRPIPLDIPPAREEPKTNAVALNTFIDEIWLPLYVRGNDRKPKTIAFYKSLGFVPSDEMGCVAFLRM